MRAQTRLGRGRCPVYGGGRQVRRGAAIPSSNAGPRGRSRGRAASSSHLYFERALRRLLSHRIPFPESGHHPEAWGRQGSGYADGSLQFNFRWLSGFQRRVAPSFQAVRLAPSLDSVVNRGNPRTEGADHASATADTVLGIATAMGAYPCPSPQDRKPITRPVSRLSGARERSPSTWCRPRKRRNTEWSGPRFKLQWGERRPPENSSGWIDTERSSCGAAARLGRARRGETSGPLRVTSNTVTRLRPRPRAGSSGDSETIRRDVLRLGTIGDTGKKCGWEKPRAQENRIGCPHVPARNCRADRLDPRSARGGVPHHRAQATSALARRGALDHT